MLSTGNSVSSPQAGQPDTPGSRKKKEKEKEKKDGANKVTEPSTPAEGGSGGGAAAAPAAPAKSALDLKHERLTGTISSYVPANGCGSVQSHMFEGELFFRTDHIMPEFQMDTFTEGQSVEFDVQSGEGGRAHAVALKPVLGKKPCDCIGQRHRGYVRRCAERWGFLNAAAFDGDLFVHRDNLLPGTDQIADGQPPLRAGQAVEFDVAVDDRGRTVAKQITTCAMMRPCGWIGHRLRGFIRSFQGAWGFINSDRFAGDLFVHRDSLLPQYQAQQLAVGVMVEFDVERDHHRKGAKNRLVARNIAILGAAEQPALQQANPYAQMQQQPQQAMPPPYPLDPLAYGMPPAQIPPAYGQAPLYYQGTQPFAGQPVPQIPDPAQLAAMGYAPQQYQFPQPPYMQQALPPAPYAQPLHPALQQQVGMLPPFQQPYPGIPQQPGAPLAASPGGILPPQFGQQPGAIPAQATLGQPGVADGQILASAGLAPVPEASAEAKPPGTDPSPGGGAVPVASEGHMQGLLHITMHDWEPDQPGQLWVTKGTLVNVSYRAAHGWVYASTVQPGATTAEPTQEGWIPQAVAKRVSLGRVLVDWSAEGDGTLGVTKGEIIAVSKEAERGWVYGELVGPRQAGRPSDGWLPKKVLDSLQS